MTGTVDRFSIRIGAGKYCASVNVIVNTALFNMISTRTKRGVSSISLKKQFKNLLFNSAYRIVT